MSKKYSSDDGMQKLFESFRRSLNENEEEPRSIQPFADDRFMKKPKPRSWSLRYRETGYGGQKLSPTDRAYLEFVPKGEPSKTEPDPETEVTKLESGDPEIQRHLDRNSYAMSAEMSKAMENLDQYDVYSVYATTTG